MRRFYLDNIRWITVFTVVFYHVFYMYNANGVAGGPGSFYDNQPWDVVQYLLYPWFMIMLFLIAGISTRLYFQNHNEREFLRVRTRKLLVPSTIGVVVFGWIQGLINVNILGTSRLPDVPFIVKVLIVIFAGTGVLWFIQMLWLFSVLTVLIRKFEKGWLFEKTRNLPLPIVVLLGVLLWLSAQLLNVPVVVCYKFGVYGMAFFLGYFVFAHQEIIDKLSHYYLGFIAFTVCFFYAYVSFYYNLNYADKPVFNSVLSICFAWFMCLSLISTFNRFFDDENYTSAFFRKNSFGLYMFHYLGISGSAYILYNYLNNLPVILIYIITCISGFVVGYGLFFIIRKIPVLRWCVLGIKE